MRKFGFFPGVPPALAVLLALVTAAPPAHAEAKVRCAVGDICELTFPLFACKDGDPLKRWVEIFVDANREKAEEYLTEQTRTGRCMRFDKGDKLRIVRYIGMSRLEVSRPGDDQRWLMLLK